MLSEVFHQLAWVVDDLQAAEAHWTDVVGVPTFFHMSGLRAAELGGTYRGEEADWGCDIALGYHGELMIELIHPTHGPSVWHEFLDAGTTGPHHIGYLVDDLARAAKELDATGAAEAMTIDTGGLRAVYYDTTASTGMFTELIELDDDGRRFFDAIRYAKG